jgi:PAS domain S-box-containing protein
MIVVVASEHVPATEGGFDFETIEAIPDAVLALDGNGFVRRANSAACRLLECSANEILSRPVAALLEPGADQFEALADALQGPVRDASCEIRLRSASGTARILDASVAPMRAGARILVLRDATVRSTELQHLARSNEELDHCIGALAHDLRSPLVGLLGFSRLLRQDYTESLDDTGRHFVDRIEQAARNMQLLIEDLLGFAKAGSASERPDLVDCQAVLRQLAAELKPRLEESGIDLSLPDGGVSRVYCDRSRLYQVFSNLIGNAIYHMGPRPGAHIEVRVDESDDGHEIVVSDNGRGVDPSDRRRIFDIFQSVGKRADGEAGTGMGLAIVKKIVERRGGRVWVDSSPEGGASFHATFPRR